MKKVVFLLVLLPFCLYGCTVAKVDKVNDHATAFESLATPEIEASATGEKILFDETEITAEETDCVTTDSDSTYEFTSNSNDAGKGLKDTIIPIVDFKNVEKISVKNNKGEYVILVKYGSDVKLENFEYTPLAFEKTSSLLADVCYTYFSRSAQIAEKDFKDFGLAEGQQQAQFELVTTDGDVYTVLIGNKIAESEEYYARVPGENVIYVIGYDAESTLFGTKEDFVDKELVFSPTIDTYCFVDNFSLKKNGESFIDIRLLREGEQEFFSYFSRFEEYDWSASNVYFDVLSKFVSVDIFDEYAFVADEIVYIGDDLDVISKHGINPYSAHYLLTFDSPIVNSENQIITYIPNRLWFSEKQFGENGEPFYYVYSETKKKLGRIAASKAEFLDYDFEQWVNPLLFSINIMNVNTISFESSGEKYDFALNGETNDVLSVAEVNSGYAPEISNFRKLWMTLVSMEHTEMRELSETEKSVVEKDENKVLEISVVTRLGQRRNYCFYRYDADNAYYTIDGEGMFLIPMKRVQKVFADVKRFMNGEEIDPYASV
ncbi:MAG: DUF4340 domain-containing protein [Clostridia bacterium]|nr:DUF4340 domain-containing protein [Clostridia bacterium]